MLPQDGTLSPVEAAAHAVTDKDTLLHETMHSKPNILTLNSI